MSKALSIIGSSRENGPRDQLDFYPTPSHITEKLLKVESFEGTICEPACGDGAISKVLIAKGHKVDSFDIEDRGFGITRNFFHSQDCYDNIITNPLFNRALDFVYHGKKTANKKIALFLKTTFLESADRYQMFKDKNFPLKKMYQFSKRVQLTKNGDEMVGKAGMIAFAWFVWDREHNGEPMIDWIF